MLDRTAGWRLGVAEGSTVLICFEAPRDIGGMRFIAGRASKSQGRCCRGDRPAKITCLRVRRGERIEHEAILVVRLPGKFFGKPQRLLAVADSGIVMRGSQPSEPIRDINAPWILLIVIAVELDRCRDISGLL